VRRIRSTCACTCRCRYATPLAGPVAPEVKTTAQPASSSGSGRAEVRRARVTRSWRTPGSGRVAMRVPGSRIARAAASPRAVPITWSTEAPRSARPMPRRPSPRSATTITAPARHTAYTAAVRSAEGGTSSATRSPGPTPAATRPPASAITRWCSWAQLTCTPPTSTTAGPLSAHRASSSAHNGGCCAATTGAGAGVWRSPSHWTRSVAYCGASSVTRCEAPSYRCSRACGRRSRRSRRCASPNTGSRGPHSSSAGTSRLAMPSAIASSAGLLGWPWANGMSATKSPTAPRRSAPA